MTLKEALEKVFEEEVPPALLAEWNSRESRAPLVELIARVLNENDGKISLREIGFLCIVCLQAGKLMAEDK